MLLAIAISPAVLAGNNWNVTLPGGNMRFQGEVIAQACSVETGDQQMVVSMGQISSNHFHSVGQEADPVSFDIHLRECSTAVSKRVGVAFLGLADGKDPDVLSVGTGAGSATGVGIAIFNERSQLIPVNKPPRSWAVLQEGATTLHFVAKYRATSRQVTGGAANAQAWFSLTYI